LIQRLRATPRGQGTDIGAGLLAAARAVGQRGATRPLVVVVTDGMLPSETTPERIRDQLERQLGRRFGSTEFLFVVDEPMIGNSGLPIDHPISELAAALGARLSLESLAGTEAQAARLLAAPKMLGELRVDAPDNVTLTAEVPKGLTAGGFAVVTATYERRPPRSLRVRGRIAGRGIVRVVPVQRKAAQPEALATVTEGDLEPVLQSGFVQPAWYRPADERTARQSIKLASYRGVIRRGFLDAPIFRYYLNTRVLPRARACYNKSLSRHADQTGRVVLEMEIGKGEVMFARAVAPQLRHPDAKLVDCLREAAWQLEIPAGTLDDQVYQLRYPLRLHPPKKRTAAGALEIDEEFLRFLLAQPSP
jgi:hypothetical protein